MTAPSDTPITDSLAFANLDDVETCKTLERALRQCTEALSEVCALEPDMAQGLFESGRSQGIAEAQFYAHNALAAVRELEEKYK